MRALFICALFALAAGVSRAQSTIVYSHTSGIPLPWPFTPPVDLDLNQDGNADVSLAMGVPICTMDIPTSFCSQPAYVGMSGSNALLVQGSYAARIPSGEWIGGTPFSNTAWSAAAPIHLYLFWHSPRDGTSGAYGPIGEAGEGYVGVRFSADDGEHYGWIYFEGWSVIDWAYESRPNHPIRAGARPVPVPLAHAALERPGYLRLTAETEIGKTYQVQTKQNLLDFAWSNLNFALPAGSTNTQVDIPLASEHSFFRVVEAD